MQTIILKDKYNCNPIELHCNDYTFEITENGSLVLNWGEILDKVKEYHNLDT